MSQLVLFLLSHVLCYLAFLPLLLLFPVIFAGLNVSQPLTCFICFLSHKSLALSPQLGYFPSLTINLHLVQGVYLSL